MVLAKLITRHRSMIIQSVVIGDSGFYIFRFVEPSSSGRARLVYKSPLGRTKATVDQLSHLDVSHAEKSIVVETIVYPGDIIVMASDGLFDNLHDHEVEHLDKKSDKFVNNNELAKQIAENALKKSVHRTNEISHTGKPDDITVLVTQILGKFLLLH